ncbi:MAG: Ribonuclease R winged-helix domain protein [Syntrophorhabdus sp. PtaB.Bin006]|nr:MAG: Ribonuclease R winged-helix domain protein [Syntrophorhabdus sp. PtaB.Bin006]
MDEKKKRKELLILNILKDAGMALTSVKIAERLVSLGHEMSERTVRLYLQQMDAEGLTSTNGKRGHHISERGLSEIDSSHIIERMGFLSAKIDRMSYQMNFDLNTTSGSLVINVTFVDPRLFAKNIPYVNKVYADGYAMGQLITFLGPGEALGHLAVPKDKIGVGTVCSITLNGVLLKHGIPTNSRFGGLLELSDKKPVRFVEIIMYDGTSIDPLEIFIRSGMTNYMGAITTGNGRIGASFREFPAESREAVEHIAEKLERVGLGGLVGIGKPGQNLLGIPVSEGRVGAIVIGGLNPVSILEENGVRAYSRALAGLIDFNRLFRYDEMETRIKDYL